MNDLRIAISSFAVALTMCVAPYAFVSNAATAAEEGHEHPEEGPHHGALIELGDEEYHAELVHDEDAATVTIYLLDGAAKKAVAIDAKELTINVKRKGKPEQYKLDASPEKSDKKGMSSKFFAKSDKLCERLDEEGADCRLRVTIGSKAYTGKIAHDHDHEGHDHKEKPKKR